MWRRTKVAPDAALVSSPATEGIDSAHASMTQAKPGEMVQWYLKQARVFEQSQLDQQRRLTRLAIASAVGAVVMGVTGLLGATAMVMLKRPTPPAVLRINDTTGQVDVLPLALDGHVEFNQMADRADLRKYVERRESYDWETIQSMYDSVKLMTADAELDSYTQLYRQQDSPVSVLKNEVRVIARANTVQFIGKDTAQVYFSKEIVPLSGGAPRHTEYWLATIAYRHDSLPTRTSELESNPTGFKITSYTVDRDWTPRSADEHGGIR
jgi:type IV secretion system protein VirB8